MVTVYREFVEKYRRRTAQKIVDGATVVVGPIGRKMVFKPFTAMRGHELIFREPGVLVIEFDSRTVCKMALTPEQQEKLRPLSLQTFNGALPDPALIEALRLK